MSDDGQWGWWASRDDEYFSVGPYSSRHGAIEAAKVEFDWTADINDNGDWCISFYIIEASGTYYDCDECGRVKEACEGCQKYDEPSFYFLNVRNREFVECLTAETEE
jgi:hypothetical protein